MQTKQADNSQLRSRQEEKEHRKTMQEKTYVFHRRTFPIWARIIVVGALSMIALFGGLLIGYGVIGDGAPLDALKPSTWKHIINIVTQEK